MEEEDLVDGKGYTFYAETQTTYGSEDGTTVMRTKREPKHMNVLAIKLFDFRVTNVTDPAVDFDIANRLPCLIWHTTRPTLPPASS